MVPENAPVGKFNGELDFSLSGNEKVTIGKEIRFHLLTELTAGG